MIQRIEALAVAFAALLIPFISSGQSEALEIKLPSGGSIGLEPVDGYFSSYAYFHEYQSKVRNLLLKGVDDTPKAMLVTLASIRAESAIVLTEQEVKILSCSEPIWNSKAPEKIAIEKRSFHVSKELADALHSLWFDSLGTTSYPDENRHGRDGASYYFTTYKAGMDLRAGTAWSPASGSLPSELLRIAHELEKLSDGDEDAQSELLTQVRSLHSKIKTR